jgi:hypothetical protein
MAIPSQATRPALTFAYTCSLECSVCTLQLWLGHLDFAMSMPKCLLS